MTKKRGANKGRRDSKAAEEPKEGTSEEEREMEGEGEEEAEVQQQAQGKGKRPRTNPSAASPTTNRAKKQQGWCTARHGGPPGGVGAC